MVAGEQDNAPVISHQSSSSSTGYVEARPACSPGRPPMKDADPPIIMLPGMAADDRLFRHLRPSLPGLVTPAWIEPRRREPLPAYAGRLARCIDPGVPCFVGGASFGGMVALEMA